MLLTIRSDGRDMSISMGDSGGEGDTGVEAVDVS